MHVCIFCRQGFFSLFSNKKEEMYGRAFLSVQKVAILRKIEKYKNEHIKTPLLFKFLVTCISSLINE